jgi:hypothetical protein
MRKYLKFAQVLNLKFILSNGKEKRIVFYNVSSNFKRKLIDIIPIPFLA